MGNGAIQTSLFERGEIFPERDPLEGISASDVGPGIAAVLELPQHLSPRRGRALCSAIRNHSGTCIFAARNLDRGDPSARCV